MNDTTTPNTTWLSMLTKALIRMSPLRETGELRLVCAIISNAVYEDMLSAHHSNTEPLRQSFFRQNFQAYCRLIGLEPCQIKEMVLDSWQYVRVTK